MIRINNNITIDEREIKEVFVRASGPGGQHVNKASTAVQLRFDVVQSSSLPEDVRDRLIHLAGKRVNDEGVLVIDARRFRSQERNRQDAMDRLAQLVRRAVEPPVPRRKTRPTGASRQRRLDDKRRHSAIKRMRQPPS